MGSNLNDKIEKNRWRSKCYASAMQVLCKCYASAMQVKYANKNLNDLSKDRKYVFKRYLILFC